MPAVTRPGLNRPLVFLILVVVYNAMATAAAAATYDHHRYRQHHQYWPPSRLREKRQSPDSKDSAHSRAVWPLHVVVALPLSEGWSYRNPFLLTLAKSQPVLDVAVDDVYWQRRLLPAGALDFSFVDTNLSDALGPQRVIEKYCAAKVDAVMGFAYVYAIAPIARMSYMWGNGVPVFTTSAMVDELGDRTQFPLLTRMMGTYKNTARLVLKLITAFGWRHIRFVFNDHAVETSTRMGRSECYFCLLAVRNIIKQEKISWTHDVFHERSDVPPDYHEILKKASMESNSARVHLSFTLTSVRLIFQPSYLGA